MKRKFLISLLLSFLALPSFAKDGHLYDVVIAPLIEKCPEFLSGDAQIEANVYYSVWATGVHAYNARCILPAKNGVKRQDPTHEVKDEEGPEGDPPDDGCEKQGGSIIQPTTRTLGETLEVNGANFKLAYFSDKVKGRSARFGMDFHVNDVNSNVTGFKITANYANGRILDQSFSNVADQTYTFSWDGLDGSNVPVMGSVLFNPTITVYAHGKEIPITYHGYYIGVVNSKTFGFGLWTPTNYHFYDVFQKRIVYGDGASRYVSAKILANNNLMVSAQDLSEVYVFSPQGQHLYTKFPLTGENKFRFEHDIYGKLVAIHEPYNRSTTFSYSGDTVSLITAPNGMVTTLSYNSEGYLSALTSPANATHEMTYYPNGLLKSFKKPEGELNTFYYDSKGRLFLDYHSSGFFQELTNYKTPGQSHSMTYAVKTPMNRETKYAMANSLLSAKESNVQIDTPNLFSYSKRSQENSFTEFWWGSHRKSTSFKPDPRFPANGQYPGYSQLSIKGLGTPIYTDQTVVLSDNDDPFSIINLQKTNTQGNKVSTETYDGLTRQWTMVSAGGRVTKRKINQFEKMVSSQLGENAPTNYSYNSRGLLSGILQGNRKTTFIYNSSDFLSEIIDPLGQTTKFQYDQNGRIVKSILPDGREVEKVYDKNGRVVGITPSGKPTHSFIYNALEKLKTYLPPEIAGSPRKTEYFYNRDNQPIRVLRPDGQDIKYEYDSNGGGNIATIITPHGNYLFQHHPHIEEITKATSADLIDIEKAYHGPFLAEEKTVHPDAPAPLARQVRTYNNEHLNVRDTVIDASGNKNSLGIIFDKDDLVIRKGWMSYARNSRGQITELKIDRAKIKYSYDNEYGELVKSEYIFDNELRHLQNLQRDKSGRLVSEQIGSNKHTRILYDKSGRFVGLVDGASKVAIEEYRYDGNDNRVYAKINGDKKTASYDNQDRLINYGDIQFNYNENGDLTQKFNSSIGDTTNYVYDTFGNLKSITMPNSDVIEYGADAFNRRAYRKLNGVVQSRYIYEDQLRVSAELDANGNLLKRFVYESGINSPDYMIFNNQRFIFVKDSRGSVLKVVHTKTGEVFQELKYDSWGRVLSDSNPGFQPFGFAGGLYDPATNLVRFGLRDYDAEYGRWLSKDPIRFDGGDTNLYGYVFQDPINKKDEKGTGPVSAGACALAAEVWYMIWFYERGETYKYEYSKLIERIRRISNNKCIKNREAKLNALYLDLAKLATVHSAEVALAKLALTETLFYCSTLTASPTP